MNLHYVESLKRDGVGLELDSLLRTDSNPLLWTPKLLDKTSAWWGHVPFAFWIVSVCKPHVLVELGTHYGVSYAAFCEAIRRLRLKTRSYAVDSWMGDPQAGYYGDEVFAELKLFHDLDYSAFSELLRMQFDDASQRFTDGTVDMLHIDGYHTYEAVSHDFNTWLPKLSSRGVVLFHDTNVRRDDFGVWQFFQELSRTTQCFEFLHGFGLGVAAVGPEAPEVVKELCRLDQDAAIAGVRQTFSRLGAVWMSANNALLEGRRHLERMHELDRSLSENAQLVGQLTEVNQDLLRRLATQHDVPEKDRLIAVQDDEIARAEAMLRERAARIVEKDGLIAAQNEEIARTKATLGERETELARKNAQLAQKEAALAEQSTHLALVESERDAARAAQATVERESAARISRLSEDSESLAREEIARTKAMLGERETELARKNAQLAQKDIVLAEHSTRLALIESERDAARAARAALERESAARISRLTEDGEFLARYLNRTFRRPWRPFKFYINYNLLRLSSALSASFSERMASRFRRSAQKRSPKRFDAYLPGTVDFPPPISVPASPGILRPPPRVAPTRRPAEVGASSPPNARTLALSEHADWPIVNELLSEYFDAEWYRAHYPDVRGSDVDVYQHFVNHGAAELRNPCGEFDCKGYLENNPEIAVHPVVHYLLFGRKELLSPKNYALNDITGQEFIPSINSKQQKAAQARRLCCLIHVYYVDLIDELLSYVEHVRFEKEVIVNLVSTTWTAQAHKTILTRFPDAKIIISPDLGRDIGGFVRMLSLIEFDQYDIFFFAHSKKSPHTPEAFGIQWRRELLDPLAGTPQAAEQCVLHMRENHHIGLIGSRKWRDTEVLNNSEKYLELLDFALIRPENRHCEFVSGTMFFITERVVRRLYTVIRNIQFEDGHGVDLSFHIDGQYAHAVERLIGNLVRDEDLLILYV